MTADHARYIYKKVEQEGIINVDTIEQQIEEDRLKNDIDSEEEVNPYCNIIINEFERESVIKSQMEQSVLGNVVNYVQYIRNPGDFYNLGVKALDQKNHRKIYNRLKEEDRHIEEIDFGDTPEN